MSHTSHMKRALELAQKGWPAVQPNPMVGSVITKGGKVVAEGYHEKFGGPHAEVIAIKALPKDIVPAECTLYVTLEPCRHHGKTPPCADFIIERGFKRVVVATVDPNPLVAGSGIRKLLEAGLEVITNVMEQEARYLNRRFITFFECKRPYVILKWALSGDGYISRQPVPGDRKENVITRPDAQKMVHQLRSECMAILVGKNTVLADNPQLTTRLVKGANPIRVVLDRRLDVPETAAVFSGEGQVWIFNEKKEEQAGNRHYFKIDFDGNVSEQTLHKLYQHNIQTLLVEGGAKVLTDLISQEIFDEVFIFENPDLAFGGGIKGPEFPLPNTFDLVGEDKLYHTENELLLKHRPH